MAGDGPPPPRPPEPARLDVIEKKKAMIKTFLFGLLAVNSQAFQCMPLHSPQHRYGSRTFQFMISSPSKQFRSTYVGSELETHASRSRFETRLNDIEAELNVTKGEVTRLNGELTRLNRTVISLYALAQSLDASRFRELRLENIAINSKSIGQVITQSAEFSIPILNIWYNISSSARDLHRNSMSTKDIYD